MVYLYLTIVQVMWAFKARVALKPRVTALRVLFYICELYACFDAPQVDRPC